MAPRTWTVGDEVRHAGRPEWGIGRVAKADGATHNGVACQRLTVKFDRAGLKTLSTAFASLEPAGAVQAVRSQLSAQISATEAESDADDIFAGASESIADVLSTLPEPATDPFRTLEVRLKATLGLYRFQPTGGSLLDWAAMQTGLADPLSKCNRHELEAHFQRFRVRLDAHLVTLVREAAKKDPAMLDRLKGEAPSQARSALDRLNARR